MNTYLQKKSIWQVKIYCTMCNYTPYNLYMDVPFIKWFVCNFCRTNVVPGLTSKKDINSEGLINNLEGFVQLFFGDLQLRQCRNSKMETASFLYYICEYIYHFFCLKKKFTSSYWKNFLMQSPYPSALDFWNSLLWNIKFDEFDIFPTLEQIFLPAVTSQIQVWNGLYFQSFKLDI